MKVGFRGSESILFRIVAFRFAKGRVESESFAEQKATNCGAKGDKVRSKRRQSWEQKATKCGAKGDKVQQLRAPQVTLSFRSPEDLHEVG